MSIFPALPKMQRRAKSGRNKRENRYQRTDTLSEEKKEEDEEESASWLKQRLTRENCMQLGFSKEKLGAMFERSKRKG